MTAGIVPVPVEDGWARAALYALAPLLDRDETEWQDRALCAQTDPEAFYPEKGGSTREAKRTCRSCEVRAECLEYALEHDERFGVWGGMSERERRGLKRSPKLPGPRKCGNGLHLLDEKNTYVRPDGTKACRLCRNASNRARPAATAPSPDLQSHEEAA